MKNFTNKYNSTTQTNETELNNPTTNAKVSKANVNYSEHERNISNHHLLSSTPFVKNTTKYISFNFNPPINQSEPFTMTITKPDQNKIQI